MKTFREHPCFMGTYHYLNISRSEIERPSQMHTFLNSDWQCLDFFRADFSVTGCLLSLNTSEYDK